MEIKISPGAALDSADGSSPWGWKKAEEQLLIQLKKEEDEDHFMARKYGPIQPKSAGGTTIVLHMQYVVGPRERGLLFSIDWKCSYLLINVSSHMIEIGLSYNL